MDSQRFDAWVRTLTAAAHSRRGMLRLLASGIASLALGLSPHAEIRARKPRARRADRRQVGTEVVDGDDVPDGKYPFVAALLNTAFGETAWEQVFCGGSLIDPTHVLTAAHCVSDPRPNLQSLRVLVGRKRLSNTTGETRGVTRLEVHPDYTGWLHDVAVLELDRPIVNSSPVAMMDGENESLQSPGGLLTVAGWGDVSVDADPSEWPDRLQEARVRVQQDQLCDELYGATTFRGATQLCAGGTGVATTCSGNPGYGDSGGPLFGALGGALRLVGVVNASTWCDGGYISTYAQVNAPAVAGFIDWATGNCQASDSDACVPGLPKRKKRKKKKRKKRR